MKLKKGKYTIVKQLGQGGFGITYLATTPTKVEGIVNGKKKTMTVNANVVVKEFFLKDYCTREENDSVTVASKGMMEMVGKYREKFKKEAIKLSQMSHPSIVEVTDVIEDENNTSYYVMKYLSGGTLYQKVCPDHDVVKPLPEDDAVKYIKQIASALGYMHKKGMCHFDVKPNNIMLDEDGKAVLIDFGLAKNYTKEGTQTSTLISGVSVGYAPLEQANANLETFSPQTDIYALGATLYFLLTGYPPKAAAFDINEVLPKGQCGISERLWSIIQRCMQVNPVERPQDIDELVQLMDNNGIDSISEVSDDGVSNETEVIFPKNGNTLSSIVGAKFVNKNTKTRSPYMFISLIVIFSLLCVCFFALYSNKQTQTLPNTFSQDTFISFVDTVLEETKAKNQVLLEDGNIEQNASNRPHLHEIAYLTVNCPTKGANIYINKKLAGVIPWKGDLPFGSYSLEIRKKNYISQSKKIVIEKNEEKIINFPELVFVPGRLKVDCNVSDAEILLDGKLVGHSGEIIENIPVGNHKVEIRGKGTELFTGNGYVRERSYIPETRDISFSNDNLRYLSVSLRVVDKSKPVVNSSESSEEIQPLRRDIFFQKGKWNIRNGELLKISDLANYMKKYSSIKITISGYDSFEDDNRNSDAIADKRANEVANEIKKLGISGNRIIYSSYGSRVQPFADPQSNRVAICVIE